MAGKVVFNKGVRTFTLRPGKDADGNDIERKLKPNESIECLDAKEYDYLTGSFKNEVMDIDKMSKPAVEQAKQYEKTIAELKDQIQVLTDRLAAIAPAAPAEPAPDKPRKKDK